MQQLKKLTWVMFFLIAFLALVMVNAEEEGRPIDEVLDYAEPDSSILFPWFTEALGIIVFFILTRWLEALPFTAVMFVIGMGMGMGAERTLNDDRLTTSILQWTQIDSEVLLLVFLPGIVFHDAFGMNVHLYIAAFWQIVNFAFPMVLAGTALVALVAFYLFPYGWSFNLAMTFGSILSATDPAAVASLMESLGAPPRLQMHIGGESMLNDGSSYVFYTIFSGMFLTELGIPGLGEDVDFGRGVAIFFRESCGAAAFGILFGLALTFFLYIFNRNLNDAENVIQILSTITVAYLAYFTADISGCSGVIAVVGTGVTAKFLGNSMINDHKMMEQFWSLVVQALNTVLFTLAGVVWGAIIGGSTEDDLFRAKDWGYLFMNYVLLNVIRFFLIFSFYPVTKRTGIGTDWQEGVFSAYAGLRGGVGISLALSLYNAVFEATAEADGTDDVKYQNQVTQLFAQVGGIVLLTLVINGTTSGPLLNKLGLAKSPDSRERLLKQLEKHFRQHAIDMFVRLLADPRFQDVELPVVQHHVSLSKNLTLPELKAAVLRNPKYKPSLKNILPYMDTAGADLSWANVEASQVEAPPVFKAMPEEFTPSKSDRESTESLQELRHFFLEVLNTVYQSQLENGELDGRDGFVSYALIQSIDFASSDVDKGKPLSDWEYAQITDKFFENKFVTSSAKTWEGTIDKKYCCIDYSKRRVGDDRAHSFEYRKLKIRVLRALSFLEAHRQARHTFSEQLSASSEVDEMENLVLQESENECAEAQQVIDNADPSDVKIIKAHYFCAILLNKGGKYTEKLLEDGVLESKEASNFATKIDSELTAVKYCSLDDGASSDDSVSKHLDDTLPEQGKKVESEASTGDKEADDSDTGGDASSKKMVRHESSMSFTA